jgi:hypothetical protein
MIAKGRLSATIDRQLQEQFYLEGWAQAPNVSQASKSIKFPVLVLLDWHPGLELQIRALDPPESGYERDHHRFRAKPP